MVLAMRMMGSCLKMTWMRTWILLPTFPLASAVAVLAKRSQVFPKPAYVLSVSVEFDIAEVMCSAQIYCNLPTEWYEF